MQREEGEGRAFAMWEQTRQLLFVLLGLEVLVLPVRREYVVADILAPRRPICC
jgi:hypothetical protein